MRRKSECSICHRQVEFSAPWMRVMVGTTGTATSYNQPSVSLPKNWFRYGDGLVSCELHVVTISSKGINVSDAHTA